ncbi:MAG: MBL fold metallo-hydrolase [Firmicutes bacterium]|nr:MBL fold metallo-hydrolase [Bacillota bacterium]
MSDAAMRVSVLASGSTGNAVYVEAGDTKVLLDAGVGIRQLQAAFKEIGVSLETLDAILVTHEHSDHVRGLAALLRRVSVPVYATAGTWSQIASASEGCADLVARTIGAGVPFTLGALTCEPFALSHDAEEPVGFSLYAGGRKLVLATDLGYASARVKEVTKGADAYILETNHDVEMLRAGPYPWHLKRRILGDKGHLSNAHAAEYLLDVMGEATGEVYLAHLSQENNRPDLAHHELARALLSVHREVRERVQLYETRPDGPTPLADVGAKHSQIS